MKDTSVLVIVAVVEHTTGVVAPEFEISLFQLPGRDKFSSQLVPGKVKDPAVARGVRSLKQSLVLQ